MTQVMPHLPNIHKQTKQSDKEGTAVMEKPILQKFNECQTFSQQSGTIFNPITQFTYTGASSVSF
jgi:hypothetical protein